MGIVGIYPGTFDPCSKGHCDIIERATKFVDRLIIAVSDHQTSPKKLLFTVDERLLMVKESIKETCPDILDKVMVESFSGLLVNYVRKCGADCIFRGLRATTDFEYEFQIASVNRNLDKNIDTLFLTATDKYQFISSSTIREIYQLGGDAENYVTPFVAKKLKQKFKQSSQSKLKAYFMKQHYGAFAPIIFFALYMKEVKRFISVPTQTIFAPAITSLLFFAVFTLALGRNLNIVNGVPFSSFIAPGLIMMGMLQNAFANTSSSMMISKMQRNLVDVLMSPISSFEFVLAFTLGATTRGIIVGLITFIALIFLVEIPEIYSLPIIIFYAIFGSMMMGLLGLLGGIISEKFDHIAAFTNFIVVPLSFLSGTFYSINRLPELFQKITLFNPFFYLIDGFRAGFLGAPEANLLLSVFVILGFNTFLFILTWYIVVRGYRIRT